MKKVIRIVESKDKKLLREKLERLGDFTMLGFTSTEVYGSGTLVYTCIVELAESPQKGKTRKDKEE